MISNRTPISDLRNYNALRIAIAETQDGKTLLHEPEKMDIYSRFIYDVLQENREGDLVNIEDMESNIDYMIHELKAAKTALK